MLILIPGATGHLGVHLVQAALKRGHQVRALGRSASKLDNSLHTQLESFVELQNIYDPTGLDKACKDVDAIIVAYAGHPVLQLDGQLAMLRAAERAGIKRFHAMSWNLDWSNMPPGVIESYDSLISFKRQAQITSSIKPLYVFGGALSMTLFGAPGSGALEGDNAIWIHNGDEREIKTFESGDVSMPCSVEEDISDFSVALVTSDFATKGGCYRFYSFDFSMKELAATYEKVRGAKCRVNQVMDIQACKEMIAKARQKAAENDNLDACWEGFVGLVYGQLMAEGTYNPEPVDVNLFPDCKRTKLEDYIRDKDWI